MDKLVNTATKFPIDSSLSLRTDDHTAVSTGRHSDFARKGKTMDFSDIYKYPLNESSLRRGGSSITKSSNNRKRAAAENPSSMISPLNLSSGEFESKMFASELRVKNKFSEMNITPLRQNLELE